MRFWKLIWFWLLGLVALSVSGCGEGEPVPGDLAHFDPIERYPQIERFAGHGLELRQLSARGVKDDGTIDLAQTTYSAAVEYHFVKATKPPADAPPVGAGGSAQWKQRVIVLITRAGDAGEESDAHGTRRVVSKGMRRVVPEPENDSPRPGLADPKCSFGKMWKTALDKGAPSGAVARVDYIDGRYDFRISDVGFGLRFDADCQLSDE